MLHLTHILLVFTGLMWVSCENSLSVVQELTREDTLSAVRATDVVYIRSDSGEVYMQLRAPLMLRFSGNEQITEFPEGFEAVFYDSTRMPTSKIKADYGINRETDQIMLAEREVEVENFQTKEVLYTQSLFWNQRLRTIHTRAAVKISSPDKLIFGDSLTASEDLSRRTIFNIRATFEIDEDENEQQ